VQGDGQQVACLDDLQGQFLEGPGDVHAPGGVAKAAPQLAVDAGDGIGDERVGATEVVAVHGGDQPDAGRLDQVLEGDAVATTGSEAGCQPVDQTQVSKDDPVTDCGVPSGPVVAEPLLDLRHGLLVIWPDVWPPEGCGAHLHPPRHRGTAAASHPKM